ncbi:PAS domain S-box protein [Cytophagales bacterium LB-30]|uniref:PAS domain S-box protein n=1 Tax=Shiella aurantiaca TaxID=3058365 RepID=A0ABT8F6Q1_9BACT|nr:PAS domain S-box protein [Shiella aurantiaca]MDN4166168.1 PAS domain S-box protein [Shiella aurantiaca]
MPQSPQDTALLTLHTHIIACPLPLWIVDAEDTEILFQNAALQSLLGYSGKEIFPMALAARLFSPSKAEDIRILKTAQGKALHMKRQTQTLEWEGRSAVLEYLSVIEKPCVGTWPDETLRLLMNSSDQGITLLRCAFDSEGELVDFTYELLNDISAQGLGKKPDALKGKCISEVFPEFFSQGLFDELAEVYRSQTIQEKELEVKEPIFLAGWYHSKIMPQKDCLLIISRNISQEKQYKTKLHHLAHTHSSFEKAVNSASIISRTDAKGSIHFVNENFVRISGYSREELIGQNHRIINSGHHPKSFWVEMWKTVASGKMWRAEVKNKAKDGSFYWVDTFIIPLLDEQNRVSEILSIRNDITISKQIEQENEKLAKAVNNSLNEIYLFNSDTLHFDYINQGALINLGYTLEEMRNMTPLSIKPEYTLASFQELVAPLRSQEKSVVVFETVHERKDRSLYPVEVHLQLNAGLKQFMAIILDISERKAQDQVLLEQQNKLDAFFQSTSEANFLLGLSYEVLAFNRVALEYTLSLKGQEVKEGTSILQYISPDHHEAITSYFDAALRGENNEIESPVTLDNGKQLYWQIKFVQATNRKGEVIGVIFTAKDITEAKRAQDEIQRLSLVASNTSNLVVFTDPSGYITWVNEGFEKKTGYSLEEVIGKKPGAFLQGPDTNPQTIKIISKALKEAKSCKVEILNYTKQGTPYWLDLEIAPLVSNEGIHLGFMAIQLVITERKKLEEDLRNSKHQLQTFMDNAPMVVFMKDRDGKYLFMNKTYHDFMGRRLPEGITDFDIFDHDFALECQIRDQKVITKGDIISFEHQVGSQTFLETKFPIKDEKGFVYAVGGTSIDITQEILLNRHIREQEERLRNITNNIPKGIAFQLEFQSRNQDFHIPYISAGAEKIFDRKASDLQGHAETFFELILPDDSEELKNTLKISHHHMRAFEGEYRINHKKDNYRWIQIKAMPRKKEDGIIWDGICMDITASKKLKLALQASEAKLQNIFQSMVNGVVVVDIHGEITFANPSAADILSLEPEEIEHRYYSSREWKQIDENGDPYPPEKLPLAVALTQQKPVFNLEHGILDNSGSIKWLNVNASPLFSTEGDLIGAVASFNDISKRKVSEKALRESVEQLQAIASNIPSGAIFQLVSSKKNTLAFTFLSPSAEGLLGIDRQEVLDNAEALYAKIHPEDISRFLEGVTLSRNDQSEFSQSVRIQKGKEYRWIKINSKARHTDKGATIWDGILIDETEIRELNTRLEQNQVQLQQLVSEKDVLIREIHHRVKNNLQVMSSVLFLKAQTLKDPAMRQLLTESRQRLRSMALIHERLMQSGGKITQLDVHDYIYSLVEELKSIHYVNPEHIRFELDVMHLELNLDQVVNCGFIINEAVTNSLKYAFDPGKVGRIYISLHAEGGKNTLRISDNGKGLPAHAHLGNTELFGMQLIKVFTSHLHGHVSLDGLEGTSYTIVF